MILDIIIGIIVISAMVYGYRTGFVYTFLHLTGWLLSVILAFVWSPWVRNLLTEKTGFYDFIRFTLLDRISDSADSAQLASILPDLMHKATHSLIGQAADAASLSIADLLIAIISFLLVVFAVKLIFFLLIGLLSTRHNDGARGFFDGFLGLFLGLIKSLILVFILLAVMVPIASLVDPKWAVFLTDRLNSSYIAGILYDNNLIMLIIRDFLV